MQNVNSKLKIIVLGTRGFPNVQGGIEKHCEQLYPIIAGKGHDVTVITRRSYVDPLLKEYKGVKLYPITNLTKKSLEAIVHTFKGVFTARRLGCDVLHVHAIGPSLVVPLARILGLNVVVTNHGPDYNRQKWGGFAKFMLKLGESWGSRFANKVISISKPIADNIKNQYKKEAVIIPNGVVMPEIMETEGALKKYGLEKGKYVLTVGRYVPEKGFHDLMQAFNYARINTNEKTRIDTNGKPRISTNDRLIDAKDWKLVIVGDADHEDDYSRGLKQNAQENENIVLTGFLTGQPLQELYSHAGLFVLPSYHEGLPIVLLEAMSYGLSCIVSDIPANREVDLSKDRYFKPGDIETMADKISEYMKRPLDDNQRKKQIDYIRGNFDWQKIANKTIAVYESLK
ncbi:MAG: glycosyltransferase family 4 protein [Candidatus Omnitrophica bacterium]|nr:glycosyltransferase family 4 protein [Candidatus Omnitrophota bacterium]